MNFRIKFIFQSLTFFLIAWFVFLALNHPNITSPKLIIHYIEILNLFYKSDFILVIVLFCLTHFFSACLSIPGSCTLLNLISGAIFGFWRGCIIVYFITMVSGCAGYFVGKNILITRHMEKYLTRINKIQSKLSEINYTFLVLLRLSPLLPYGVINIVLGYLKINFKLFFFSTFVGIFFDVVLLNSAGALINGGLTNSIHTKANLAIAFVLLFLFPYCVKILSKMFTQKYKF